MVRDTRCGSVTAPAGRSIKRCADPTRLGQLIAGRSAQYGRMGWDAAQMQPAAVSAADRRERSR